MVETPPGFSKETDPAKSPATPRAPGPDGCLPVGLVILMALWILLATAVYQTLTWLWEQQFFEGSFRLPNVRWLILLVYALAVLAPAAIIWLAGKQIPNRAFFAALGLAAGFDLFLVPARLAGVTQELGTLVLLILGAGLYGILLRWRLPVAARPKAGWHGWRIALLLGGALAIPWLLWGALGSIWDTLLSLAAALFFGLVAARILAEVFRRPAAGALEDLPPAARRLAALLQGFVAGLVLLVMVSGLGVNGNQGLLSLSVPLLGWALAALYSRQDDAQAGPVENRRALALLLGLAAFWPMAFIDPDEMAAVISLGQGELIQWANLAALVGLGIGLLGGVALWVTRPRLPLRGTRAYSWAVGILWLAAVGVYLGPGQPGLYGERLFVILKDQADLSGAARIGDYHQRRSTVYRRLVDQADASQAALRRALDTFGIRYTPYYLENALEVQAGPLVRWWLMRRPEVSRVLDSPILRPLPEPVPQSHGSERAPADTPWNLKMIGADRVWHELGVTGKGVVVGQSDSGVQGDHPELADSYRGRGAQNDYNWLDPWYASPAPVDIGGHGTHTLGTVLGNQVGVAPDAEWIGCVNLARNLGNPALYLDCMQFMLAPFPQHGDPLEDGRPERGAHVLNNSWGCPPVEGCDATALLPAVSALRAAGIFVVASAGNEGEGGCATVSDPIALYPQVYSVGAVNAGGQLTSFSSKGPVEVDGSGRIKPDISAPGEAVLSAFPGGSYSELSGTSMAGPHVTGVVALMWSANPALIGDVDRTQQILDQSASAYAGSLPACVAGGKPNNGVGYGVLNAYEAVRRAMGK